MKIKATFPFIDDMGSVDPIIGADSFTETTKENVLWHLNRMREHDGLKPLTKLPPGTEIEVLEE